MTQLLNFKEVSFPYSMTSNKIFVLPFVDDHFIEALVFDVGPQDNVATLLARINNVEDILGANLKFERLAVVGPVIAKLEGGSISF